MKYSINKTHMLQEICEYLIALCSAVTSSILSSEVDRDNAERSSVGAPKRWGRDPEGGRGRKLAQIPSKIDCIEVSTNIFEKHKISFAMRQNTRGYNIKVREPVLTHIHQM